MRAIVALSDENAGQVRTIARSISELTSHSDGINGALETVNRIAQETIEGMNAASGIIKELIAQADRLDTLIAMLRGEDG